MLFAGAIFTACTVIFGSGDTPFLTKSDYDTVQLVVTEKPTAVEERAVETFQRLWNATTGSTPPVVHKPSLYNVNIWIGTAGARFVPAATRRWLGEDGVYIETISREADIVRRGVFNTYLPRVPTHSRHMAITGGTRAGVYYAVLEFFERYMGVRWFAPNEIQMPPAPDSIPSINYQYRPPFPYRDISYKAYVDDPEFAALHRLNGFWSEAPADLGGHTSYVRGWPGYGHTTHSFVPPDRYFDEHPEYFAEVEGERIREGQLCLTNEDVLRITTDTARELLRQRQPNQRILSVSQMDLLPPCECAACRAIDDPEGSQSATILRFVNAVAEALEPEFPDVLFDTFAYMYSRKPPKSIRPRDNVIVRLCAIEADYSRPLSDPDSPRNAAIAQDLRAWSAISKHLYVWDYTQNWYSHQGPHPNMPVFFPNAAFLAENGVEGVFEQASPFSPHSDFEHLKGYLLAKALWNPHDDWRKHYDEFLNGYYRTAAPYIREYLDLIIERVQQDDVVMEFINRMSWMDYDLVERTRKIFGAAVENISNPQDRRRLALALIPVQYAALVCPPRVELADSKYVLSRPRSMTLDQYMNMLTAEGVTHLEDYPIETFRERLGGETPPRHAELPIERLVNERFEVWVVAGVAGAIVRIHDMEHDVDYLDGWNDPTQWKGMLTDWFVGDDAESGAFVTAPYAMEDRDERYISLATALGDGIRLRRTIELEDAGLKIRQIIENTGDGNLIPDVGVRAEWNARGRRTPRVRADGETRRLSHRVGDRKNTAAREVTPVDSIEFDLPGRHDVVRYSSDATGILQYPFDPHTDTLAVVLHHGEAPIPPGQRRDAVVAIAFP